MRKKTRNYFTGPRGRGRPSHVWSNQVHSMALRVTGGAVNLHTLLLQRPDGAWQTAVRQFCAQLHYSSHTCQRA